MRSREEIENEWREGYYREDRDRKLQEAILEALLDIRDILEEVTLEHRAN